MDGGEAADVAVDEGLLFVGVGRADVLRDAIDERHEAEVVADIDDIAQFVVHLCPV